MSAPVDVEQELSELVHRYCTLSEPEWLTAGSTSEARYPDERQPAPTKRTPAPVDLNVLDALLLAEHELGDLVNAVRAEHGLEPLPLLPEAMPSHLRTPSGGSQPRRRAPLTVDQVREHANWLAKAALPEGSPLAVERAKLAREISRDLGRLLGWEKRIKSVATCPHCECPSIIMAPWNDDLAVCANRQCVDDEGERRHWSHAAGEWVTFGWGTPAEVSAEQSQPIPA